MTEIVVTKRAGYEERVVIDIVGTGIPYNIRITRIQRRLFGGIGGIPKCTAGVNHYSQCRLLDVAVGYHKFRRSRVELEAGADGDFVTVEGKVIPEDAVDDLYVAVV